MSVIANKMRYDRYEKSKKGQKTRLIASSAKKRILSPELVPVADSAAPAADVVILDPTEATRLLLVRKILFQEYHFNKFTIIRVHEIIFNLCVKLMSSESYNRLCFRCLYAMLSNVIYMISQVLMSPMQYILYTIRAI
jgi:hypothetical protein